MKHTNTITDYISTAIFDLIKGNKTLNDNVTPVISKMNIIEYNLNKKIYKHVLSFNASEFFRVMRSNNNQQSSWLTTFLVKNKDGVVSFIEERFLISHELNTFNFKCYHYIDGDIVNVHFVTESEQQKFIDYCNKII